MSPAAARKAELQLIEQSPLEFGDLIVLGSGSRTVQPDGRVRDNGVVSVASTPPRAARYVLQYDRGNNANKIYNVEVAITFLQPPRFNTGNVNAELLSLSTDLPGFSSVRLNQPITVTLSPCRRRTCELAFNVGGTMVISASGGSADVEIGMPASSIVIEVHQL